MLHTPIRGTCFLNLFDTLQNDDLYAIIACFNDLDHLVRSPDFVPSIGLRDSNLVRVRALRERRMRRSGIVGEVRGGEVCGRLFSNGRDTSGPPGHAPVRELSYLLLRFVSGKAMRRVLDMPLQLSKCTKGMDGRAYASSFYQIHDTDVDLLQ